MTDELFVHHHYTSYFSEKVRVVLGIKNLAWRSVIEPLIEPRPEYLQLTGGYQRVPALQIGADVYCDSRLVIAELERRHPDPPARVGLDEAINAWVDRYLTPATFAVAIAEIASSLEGEFLADRQRLYGPAFDLDGLTAAAGPMRGQWRAQAAWLERSLAALGGPFLLGAEASSVDAVAYPPFWMFEHRDFLGAAMEHPRAPCDIPAPRTHQRAADDPLESLLAGLDRVRQWRRDVAALGYGRATPASLHEMLAAARDAEPGPLPEHDVADPLALAPGTGVTVIADDSARDPVAGELAAVTAERVVLRREDPALGAVHVHLPREGYVVSPA